MAGSDIFNNGGLGESLIDSANLGAPLDDSSSLLGVSKEIKEAASGAEPVEKELERVSKENGAEGDSKDDENSTVNRFEQPTLFNQQPYIPPVPYRSNLDGADFLTGETGDGTKVNFSAFDSLSNNSIPNPLSFTKSSGNDTSSDSNVVHWVGDSGFWDNPTNWSTGKLPGASDEVVIDVPSEVVITFREGSASIAKLTTEEDLVISGGSLTIFEEGLINNDFNLSRGTLNTTGTVNLLGENNQWSGGTLSGSGTVNIVTNATLNITEGYYKDLRNNITLNNEGTVIWDNDRYYRIDGDSGSTGEVINNKGVFEIKNDRDFQYLTFNNEGTLIKSDSTGRTDFDDSIFNNTGTVDLRQGELNFRGGGRSDGGSFKLAADTIAQWNGNYVLDANTTLTSEGKVLVSGGKVDIQTEPAKLTDLKVSGGVLNLAGKTVDLDDLVISNGTLNLSGTTNINENFNLSRGTLNTTGTVNLLGENNQWSGGTLSGSGTVNIVTNATLNITEGYYKDLRNNITLNNEGTVIWDNDS